MTKSTAALITMLVAGVVPFGRAICEPGEVGVSELKYDPEQGLPPFAWIWANDCGIIDWGDQGSCGPYFQGSIASCDGGKVIQVIMNGDVWGNCYDVKHQACDASGNIQRCCQRQTPYNSE